VDWSSAREWLLEVGFAAEDDSSAVPPLVFVGSLETQFGNVPLRLILDPKGIRFPSVQLLRRPGWLPENCAHLNSHLFLCCTDKATAAPDRRFPKKIAEHVLLRARKLIEELVVNGGHVADEFVKLWGGEDHLAFGYLPPSEQDDESWHIVKTATDEWGCIAPSSRLSEVKQWLGVSRDASCLRPIHIAVASELLAGGPGWPIRSIVDLNDWLGFIDPAAQHELEHSIHALAAGMARLGFSSKSLFILLHHSQSVLGIMFDVAPLIQWLPTGVRRRPLSAARQIEQALLRRVSGNPRKYRFVDVESARMLARALGDNLADLSGKRIILIGAGSVGSHIGMALARSGAGVGGGTLTIYDPDHVTVENIARSAFDTRHIGLNKAEALASMLRATLVDVSLSPIAADVPTAPSELVADLIVDASGDHAFSTWLSAQKLTDSVPPIIFCWVSGPGAAVVTYLQTAPTDSCLACLGPADAGSQWNPLIASETPVHLTGPCGESFMPYSVGAPMMAAGLAVTHMLDWARGILGSPVRSIALSPTARLLPTHAPDSCGCTR
jgi:hypothetical protein